MCIRDSFLPACFHAGRKPPGRKEWVMLREALVKRIAIIACLALVATLFAVPVSFAAPATWTKIADNGITDPNNDAILPGVLINGKLTVGTASLAATPATMYTYDTCLLYTSDAADDLLCVDLGGRRIIK